MDVTGLADETRRLADRLRSLSDVRLARALPEGGSVAAAGLAVAQRLADLAAGVEQRDAPDPPLLRQLPAVSNFAVGDVLAVTGQDLVAAVAAAPPEAAVWLDGSRRSLAASLANGQAACRALRLAL